MSRSRALLPMAVVAALLLAGCGLLPGSASGPYPEACAELGFTERQCAAVVARAQRLAQVDADEVAAAAFVPVTRRSGSLGGYQLASVRLELTDGTTRTQEVWCVGITMPDDLVCAGDPTIFIAGGLDHDVTCTGEPPEGCATLPPTPRPGIVARAQPLTVAALDVPLDRVGRQEIRVGEAGLPDGVLSESSARLAEPRPTAFWIEGGVRVEVRPLLAGRPPVGSAYRDPYDGVEPVEVFLVFEVTEVAPGAVLEVRDIVVR